MTLFQAWGDSLSLLKPKNLKLFVLVTLKSIIDAYKVLVVYWWWLFAIIAGCYIMPYAWTDSLMVYEYAEIISRCAYQVLLFATIVSTRPSLMPKDWDYFKCQMIYFIPQF